MNTIRNVTGVETDNASASAEASGYFNAGVASMYDDMAVLTLYENGMIHDCNKAGGKILGCPPAELTWQHISRLLPQLQEVVLFQGRRLNPYLHFLSRVGHHFEVISLNGAHSVCRIFFSEMESLGRHFLRVIICPIEQDRAIY
jgi:hypothetical protein